MFPITAKNTGTTVLPNVKLPPPTTVSTVPPSASLITVKSTGTIVRASVRSLPETTAGTGVTTAVLTAANPIGATVLPSARPAMPTTAGTERQFRYRPTPTARPTTPTALPNVPPGAVTLDITNPGQAAFRKKKTCEDYGYESPGLFPINWDCSSVSVSGLKCYRCVKGPVCPSDTATYCKKFGYGHVRCKVGTVSSQTQEPCPCNSGYWKCVGTAR